MGNKEAGNVARIGCADLRRLMAVNVQKRSASIRERLLQLSDTKIKKMRDNMIKSFKKKDGGHVIYCKPMVATYNFKTGKSKPIEITEEEEAQYMYDSICEDQRREDFDKNIISLIKNYEGEDKMKNWNSIEIRINSDDFKAELNIYNRQKEMERFYKMINQNK